MHFRLFVVFFCCLFTTAGQSPVGALKGHIHGPAGGLGFESQVRIELWNFDEGVPHTIVDKVIYTDSEGNFSVQLAPGVYDVFVSSVEGEPVAKRLKIISGKETTFSPKLKRSPLTEYIQ